MYGLRKVKLKIKWPGRLEKTQIIHLTSIINLIIPFHSVFVTIQQSERNFFLKGTTS
jgi:hypothetical protein